MQDNYITESFDCQVKKILKKAQIKKSYSKKVVAWLTDEENIKKANNVENCATMIGFTGIGGVAHVTKANFCRERICPVCAWRRQSKFVAQMSPVLERLSTRGFQFLFVTLTVRNVPYEDLSGTVSLLLSAYDKLLHVPKIKRAWSGKVRSLEVTFNAETQTFHPHLHLLVAVLPDYFKSANYVNQTELINLWQNACGLDYAPSVDISKVDDVGRGAVEVLKYAFKPSVDELALKGFFYALKNRRLVSFSGIFAEERKLLQLSSFEDVLTDDIGEKPKNTALTCMLFKFDVTGGVYKFYDKIESEV